VEAREAVAGATKSPATPQMPPTGLLSALVRPSEAGRVAAAELKQDRLAVKFARACQPVPGPLTGDRAVEEAHLFERLDRPHALLGTLLDTGRCPAIGRRAR
jgi:hypothetical protein